MREFKSLPLQIKIKTSKPESESETDFCYFLQKVEEKCNSLSFHQMIELKSRVHKVYVKRFKQKQSEPKYGSINKGFTELELQRFLRSVPNDKFRLLFKYQVFLGLRIGEVCKLQIGNIDFEKRELTIFSEKRQKPDSMIIPHELYLDTIEFIKSNMDAIKSSDEYLFFKDHGSHSKEVHIDVNYTRKIFRQAVLKAGLDSTYAYADETTRKIAYV